MKVVIGAADTDRAALSNRAKKKGTTMSNETQNPVQQIMALTAQVQEAKIDRDEKQATLKAHHKAVYMPMCMEKKAAEENYDVLAAKLKRLLTKNSALVDALRGIK